MKRGYMYVCHKSCEIKASLHLLLRDLQDAHAPPCIHKVANDKAPALTRCSTLFRIQQLEGEAERQELGEQALRT